MKPSRRKLEQAVKWVASGFGLMAYFYTPAGHDAVIVCVNGGSCRQLRPVALRLAHQVYYKDCQRWLKENDATEITAIPFDHRHYVAIPLARLSRHPRRKAK